MQTLPNKNDVDTFHEARGVHLLLTLKDCQTTELIHDGEGLRKLVVAAAEAAGATVMETIVHKFQPQGLSVLAVLAESHASLHTYPESNTVFWDCFTCGTTCDPELSEEVLSEALQPSAVNKLLVERV
jgi:S-adenosylmethionine decarboxylase